MAMKRERERIIIWAYREGNESDHQQGMMIPLVNTLWLIGIIVMVFVPMLRMWEKRIQQQEKQLAENKAIMSGCRRIL